MKNILNYLLVQLLIFSFSFAYFLNNDLKFNEKIDKNNLNYQNQEIENNLKYSSNSISSQQFIDDLKSVPEGGTYELQANVDFSNSENDNVTGIILNDILIYGNGYTLYNRNITEVFNTDTFEVSGEHNGLGYYSFFKKVNYCYIYDLNFDNFMLPFGIMYESSLENVNFYNLNYQNLIFNVISENISDDYDASDYIDVKVSTIGLIFQEINSLSPIYLLNCCFEDINFSNNTIILFDNNISVVVAPIGGIQIFLSIPTDYPNPINFYNIYINNITFSDNKFISEINKDDLLFENDAQEKYFSIFYNPFIGSATNNFEVDGPLFSTTSWNQIIFNNINIYGNSNDFANYTFYSLLPSVSTGVTFIGKYVYGFNLNIDFQTQIDNGENIGLGTLSEEDFYYGRDGDYKFDTYSGVYQLDLNWLDEVYYQYIALHEFSSDEFMMEEIYSELGDQFYYYQGWYYDKLTPNQDYSLILTDKPMIIHDWDDFYHQNTEPTNFRFHLSDGRYDSSISDIYYSNYTINLINKDNDEIIWTEYAPYAPYSFEVPIYNYDLLTENNLYFEIYNDYHTWEQDLDFRKFLPEIYNVSSVVENNNLKVSYEFIDTYNLINSINIYLYNSNNNNIESKTIDYNDITNSSYLNQENILFKTKIENPSDYYLKFEVNCALHKYSYQNIWISTLNDDLIQYNENNDVEFLDSKIIPPDSNNSIPFWLFVFLIIFAGLILIILLVFLIYYWKKKKKKLTK